jgi:hypothetical protein
MTENPMHELAEGGRQSHPATAEQKLTPHASVMLHLTIKAFHPAPPPFPLLHVDTTWKFRDMIAFRDATAKRLKLDLLVYVNEDGVRRGIGPIASGSSLHTHVMKTEALKQALDKYGEWGKVGAARTEIEDLSAWNGQPKWLTGPATKAQRPDTHAAVPSATSTSQSIVTAAMARPKISREPGTCKRQHRGPFAGQRRLGALDRCRRAQLRTRVSDRGIIG